MISYKPNIQYFDLSGCNGFSNSKLAYCLLNFLRNGSEVMPLFKDLQLLYMPSVSALSDEVVCAVAKNCTALQCLYLSNCEQVTDVSVKQIGNEC